MSGTNTKSMAKPKMARSTDAFEVNRKYPRVPVHCEVEISKKPSEPGYHFRTIDISAGGMAIEAEISQLCLGSKIHLHITLGKEKHQHQFNARVVRCVRSSGMLSGKHKGFGVEFAYPAGELFLKDLFEEYQASQA